MPVPPVSGERVRNLNVLRELARRDWQLSLFSLLDGPALSSADARELDELCEEVVVEPVRRSAAARYARMAWDVATSSALHEHFVVARSAVERLHARLGRDRFDVVVVGQLHMYPYLPTERRSTAVLDALNVEARRIRAMGEALGRTPRGLVARLQAAPVKAYEDEAVRSVARTVAVSPHEQAYFEQVAPGRVSLVSNGVDCAGIRPRASLPPDPSLLFLGSMDYSANVDAVEHLVDDVLPQLARRDATLTVVGSNPRRAVHRAAERASVDVRVTGQVDSTRPFYERSRLLVVPLRYGGGTRLKILEALAYGVPVVTTSIGCEGLDVVHERDLVVADGPDELASWIDRLLEDDELCEALARQGRATVEERYDWERIGSEFDAVLRTVVA